MGRQTYSPDITIQGLPFGYNESYLVKTLQDTLRKAIERLALHSVTPEPVGVFGLLQYRT